MNTLHSSAAALFLTSVLLAGCTTTSDPVDHQSTERGTAGALFSDMPLPEGSLINNEQSLILGGGADWTGRVAMTSPYPPTQVFVFFRDQFPTAGWTPVAMIMSDRSSLVFTKRDRTATIEISRTGNLSKGATILLTVTPSVSGGAAVKPTGPMVR